MTTLKELFPIAWHKWRRSYLNLPCEKVSRSSEAWTTFEGKNSRLLCQMGLFILYRGQSRLHEQNWAKLPYINLRNPHDTKEQPLQRGKSSLLFITGSVFEAESTQLKAGYVILDILVKRLYRDKLSQRMPLHACYSAIKLRERGWTSITKRK